MPSVRSITINHLTSVLLITLFPFALLALCYNYILITLSVQRKLWQRRNKQLPSRTVLISGISTVQGLQTARALHNAGHKVIGVDLKRRRFNIAKTSRAVNKYYPHLPESTALDYDYWIRYLSRIIHREQAELWIDHEADVATSTVAQIRQRVTETTKCACIAPDAENVRKIAIKTSFLEFLHDSGLPAPESYRVKSRGEIHNILNRTQGKKHYALRAGDDAMDTDLGTILPRRTVSQTYNEVATVKIASDTQMVMEEYLDTSITYTCNGIVVRGALKDFWASRTSRDNGMAKQIPLALAQAFENFLQAIAHALGPSFSSHLSVSFCLIEQVTVSGVVQRISPLRGSLQLDHRVIRALTPVSARNLVSAYLSALDQPQNGCSPSPVDASRSMKREELYLPARQVYFFTDMLRDLVVKPSAQLIRSPRSARAVLQQYVRFAQSLLLNQDAYYYFLDPAPAFWQYLVVEPAETLFGVR